METPQTAVIIDNTKAGGISLVAALPFNTEVSWENLRENLRPLQKTLGESYKRTSLEKTLRELQQLNELINSIENELNKNECAGLPVPLIEARASKVSLETRFNDSKLSAFERSKVIRELRILNAELATLESDYRKAQAAQNKLKLSTCYENLINAETEEIYNTLFESYKIQLSAERMIALIAKLNELPPLKASKTGEQKDSSLLSRMDMLSYRNDKGEVIGCTYKTADLATLDSPSSLTHLLRFVKSNDLWGIKITNALLNRYIKKCISPHEDLTDELIMERLNAYFAEYGSAIDAVETFKQLKSKSQGSWSSIYVNGGVQKLFFGFDFGSLQSLETGANATFAWQRKRARVLFGVKGLSLTGGKEEGKSSIWIMLDNAASLEKKQLTHEEAIRVAKTKLSEKVNAPPQVAEVIASHEAHAALKDIQVTKNNPVTRRERKEAAKQARKQ